MPSCTETYIDYRTEMIIKSEAGEKVQNGTNNIHHLRNQEHVTQRERKEVYILRTSQTWLVRANDQ